MVQQTGDHSSNEDSDPHPSLGSSDLTEPPPSPTCHFTCLCEGLIPMSPPLFYLANTYVVLTMYQALNTLEIIIHLSVKK